MTFLTTTRRREVRPGKLNNAARESLRQAVDTLLRIATELDEQTADQVTATQLAHGLVEFMEVLR